MTKGRNTTNFPYAIYVKNTKGLPERITIPPHLVKKYEQLERLYPSGVPLPILKDLENFKINGTKLPKQELKDNEFTFFPDGEHEFYYF
ncbi:MAG: hypothetical protein H7Y00_09260 [Fimbriimonadaceae bacterium]|nr:hypothetical protein [Chitinophagales bacterium]